MEQHILHMIRIIELVIIFHSKVDWVMFKNQDFSLKKLDFTETSLFEKGNDPIKLRQYQSFADALQRLDQGKLLVRCKSWQIMMYYFESVKIKSEKNKPKCDITPPFWQKTWLDLENDSLQTAQLWCAVTTESKK